MRRLVVAAVLMLGACGGDDAPSNRGTVPATVEVPTTIVGELEITVEEGPVGADDLSEVNFGAVTTDDGPVLIEVWADVVRAAGLTREDLVAGGRFRVEIDREAEYSALELRSYHVSALSRDG